ncbi:MAG TPA: FtsX-like permease family protein [Streptosporangiaceae bacterium]
MFLTYLRRELRRRMRQAIIIAVGLALGIGLVIVVTSVSSGVKNAQASVLHSLYGAGTDITVTKTPTAGTGGTGAFGFRGQTGTRTRPAAGTTIDVDTLRGTGLGSIASTSVTTVSKLKGVAAAAGGLTLTDTKITGKIPAINSSGSGSGTGGFGGSGSGGGAGGGSGGGGFAGSFTPTSFTVDGVDIGNGELGPLSSGKLTSGRTFTSADASADVAVLDSNYATSNKLTVGSTITVAKTSFKVIGIVTTPSAQSSTDSYIPLARAQALASLKNDVNTIYVSSTSASNVTAVSKEISSAVPKATVTNSSDLANEVTGSLASTSSLANNLGKWLAIAVLVAAFLLASLLTMSAVSRRVREFGTLKALGWRSRRIVGQVMGESVAVGVIGAVLGVILGLAGTQLVNQLAPPLKASVGAATTGTATPGGARQFTAGGAGAGGGFGGAGGGTGTRGAGGAAGGFGGFRRTTAAASHTVAVHLTAPVTIGIIILAVVLAIAGGVIAGSFGGWRAARLRPAEALAKVA